MLYTQRALLCFLFSIGVASFSAESQADFIISGFENFSPEASKEEVNLAAEEARQFLKMGDLDGAREKLVELCEEEADLPHPEIMLSQLLIEQNRVAEARQLLEKLSAVAPDRFDLHFAFCHLAINEGRWFDGYLHAVTAGGYEPPSNWSKERTAEMNKMLLKMRAQCCIGRSDWAEARDIYQELTNQATPSVEILLGLGRALFHLDEIEEATNQFKLLHQQDPATDPPYLILATLWDGVDEPEKAEAAFQQALKANLAADQVRARLAYGRWLIWNNRGSDARDAVAPLEVTTDESQSFELQYLRALAARMEGNLEQARQLLSPLHQQHSDSFVVGNQLALVLAEHSDELLRARALQIAETNVRNNPRLAEAWSTLGWVHYRLGDTQAADESLQRALRLGSLSREAAYGFATVKRSKGDDDSAQELSRFATEMKGPVFTSTKPEQPSP